MSQGGPPPVSYKTNVNRMKTQRWVEARHYNYDGDDWGDADEYDEYDGYDQPEPPKATGLRQPGQAAGQAPQQGTSGSQPSWRDSRQQAQAAPQPPYARPPNERQNSFGRGDDRQSLGQPLSPGSGPSSRSRSPIVSPIRTAYGQQLAEQQPPPNRGSTPASGRGVSSGSVPRVPLEGRTHSPASNISAEPPNRRDVVSPPGGAPQPPYAQQQRPSSSSSSNPPAAAPRERADSSSSKTLPFIRPADIYKRMQEEKDKQRQSQESSRTSLDKLPSEKAREPSPGKSGDDSDSSRARKAPLDPVAERKSEYRSDGMLSPTKIEALNQTRRKSGSPQLPEMSGFGDDFGSDFGSSFLGSESGPNKPAAPPSKGTAPEEPRPKQLEPTPAAKDSESGQLQHAPSQGFRSAVHQAFDQPAVPETPSSASGSNVGRSNSESTSAISPIISRGPSDAQPQSRSLDAEVKDSQFPTIAEEPTSVRNSTDRGRTSAAAEKPPGFIPGYRRDASTPSPDNSPARKATVETSHGLRQPQEVKLASGIESSKHSAPQADMVDSPVAKPIASTEQDRPAPSKSPRTSQPSSRAGSPSKGRVRDLAEKIESGPSSRRGSQDSATGAEKAQRPQSGRLESFRPSLPGGWNSYTTNPTPGSEASSAHAAATAAAAPVTAPSPISKDSLESPSTPTAGASTADHPHLAANSQTPLHLGSLPTEGAASSILPTPQGMGDGHDLSKDAEYFNKVAPLNTKSAAEASASAAAATDTPARYPNLSTESSPSDQESDRLRKQLVRELSPQHETAPPLDPRIDRVSTAANDPRHDSAVVPSEYERYWTNSSYDRSSAPPPNPEMDPSEPVPGAAGVAPPPAGTDAPNVPPSQASQAHKANVRDAPLPQQPLQRRFSWEASEEQLGQEPDDYDMASPATDFQAASQPHQASHAAQDLYSPPPESDLPEGVKHLPPQPGFGANDMEEEEDLNLLNTPQKSAFMAANDPMHGSPQAAGFGVNLPNKVMAFREVVSLQSPDDRLRNYAIARTNLAKQEQDLGQWLTSTDLNGSIEPPPNSDLATHGPSSSFRARAPSGPMPPSGSASNVGTATAPLGSSPSTTTKLSSQQVQAKGKDLLHTAGVFGGKANVAAKGLFAKGRNKLRNAAGDKVDH